MTGKTPQSYDVIYRSPVGKLGLQLAGERICGLHWLPSTARATRPKTELARRVCQQLDSYFDSHCDFSGFSYLFSGTPFQQRVWRALVKIKPGKCMTYGQLARQLKSGSRAVGQACRTNPIALMVPCHRVVSAQGLGGYMGKSRQYAIKQWLLEHEGVEWQKIPN